MVALFFLLFLSCAGELLILALPKLVSPSSSPFAAAPVDSVKADSAKTDTTEVLEAKAAVADTAKQAVADSAKVESVVAAADSTAAAPADSAKTEQAPASSEPRTAGQTIMENPLEFLIVSAAFIASVLVIIFTGKD